MALAEDNDAEVARLRAIADLTNDLIFVSNTKTGECIDVNVAACGALGFARADAAVQKPFDLAHMEGLIRSFTGV